MQDTRTALPRGTRLELLSTGSVFEISGEPIGFGGGGVIYPARRMILKNGEFHADGIYYALKECFPASDGQDYSRSETGAIIARNPECSENLARARERHVQEKERNQDIHVTADRMLPILESADTIALTLPGKETTLVSNAVSVMESLEKKGRSLSDCLAERRRFSALETCRILQQLLFALREVHRAGYLHLDLQGGNVFLRGTLEDKSDFLTLIDFGSARSLLEDGKTEQIRDREIFTSRGFSAPEMLLNNTGTLQLDVGADIYSVGCIALYLLTGQRPNSSQLLANRSGKYLKPNHMRWVGCPVHLQDQLQALIAKALEKKPENRYRSADEMLEKVNQLLDGIQKAIAAEESVLSPVTYDAFLCYKHGPVDSPVAKALQQRLEHFHTTNHEGEKIQPFRKVFLDEGELAACADFGQQIYDALKNSKWLVVICSEDTPLSPWVELEIKTFLEIHRETDGEAARSRILTVLTSGEPEASIPACLQEEGKMPFAADIRGENLPQILKNLKGDAFLRLAAAMLDRPFDALKQRQKVYFLQRVAAVTAVFLLAAVAFGLYAANRARLIAAQAVRIQEEYENALINESMLLSEQAEKQLKNHNPLEAMALALQALPSAEQDRPVVTEAEYVLGKSLGIYVSPGAAEDTVTAVSTIDTDDDRFFLDDTGTFLFTWKSYENGIRIWDAENLSPVRELLPREGIYHTAKELLIPEQDALLLRTGSGIRSLNYRTGEQNWSFEKEYIRECCLSEDRTRVVLLSEQEDENGVTLQLEILSAADGTSERQHSFRMDPNHDVQMQMVVSPDLKWAAVPAVDRESYSYIESVWNSLYLINLEDGSCRKLFDTDTAIVTMTFAEDRIAVVRGSGYTLTTMESGTVHQYTTPIRVRIETYDPESGSLLWCSEQRYRLWDDNVDFLRVVPYDTGTAAGKGLLAVCADLCVLLDWDSGQVLREYELRSAALDLHCGSNGFETLNADGSSSAASFTMDTLLSIQHFDDSVSAVCRHQDNYYVQSTPVFSKDYSIRKYVKGKSDETYTKLFGEEGMFLECFDYRSTADGIRMVLTGNQQLCFADSADGSFLVHEIPEACGFSPYRVVGISPDAHRVYWKAAELDSSVFWITDYALWETDLLTGESRQVPVPEKPEEYIVAMDSVFFEESLFFTASIPVKGGTQVGLFRWNLAEDRLEELCRYSLVPAENPEDEVEMYHWEDYQYGSLQLDAAAEQISFATVTHGLDTLRNLLRVNFSGEETARISPDFTPEPDEAERMTWKSHCYQWSPDGTQAVIGWGGYAYLIGPEGNLICRVPAAGYQPVIRFLPDGESLLVLTEDTVLRQYRTSDGACLADIDLNDHLDTSVRAAEKVQLVSIDENTVVLFNGSDGFLLDVSGGTVKIRACIDQSIGYDAERDWFLVSESASRSGKEEKVGAFRRYSLEQLLQKANAILDKQA